MAMKKAAGAVPAVHAKTGEESRRLADDAHPPTNDPMEPAAMHPTIAHIAPLTHCMKAVYITRNLRASA